MDINMPYKAVITREQFLFHEMRTTAKLLLRNENDDDVIKKIVDDNLFQYPTERMIKNLAGVCVRRLRLLNSDNMIEIVANGSPESAKQICLYSMMISYKLIWEFMTTVIADKYKNKDFGYSKVDINSFFTRLQEQNDDVAIWTEKTINKLKQVITKMLVDNDYLDDTKAEKLNPVLIDFELKNYLLERKEKKALAAFNCFE